MKWQPRSGGWRWLLTASLAFFAGRDGQAQQPDSSFAFPVRAVRIREHPDTFARIIAIAPVGARPAVSHCDTNWCEVSLRRYSGFVVRRALTFDQTAELPIRGRGYINSRGQWVPSPQPPHGAGAPAGASAQCRDSTYSYSQSRRGTCSHHGGVSRWLEALSP